MTTTRFRVRMQELHGCNFTQGRSMSLALVYTRAQLGIEAPSVCAEIHLANGLPGFTIVGLPEKAVKESKDRVRSAIQNSQFEFPQKRITVNLAPADLPKEGGRYDLAIAVGILAASKQIDNDQLQRFEFYGELALTGELRAVRAVLPSALAGQKQQRIIIAPEGNEAELALCQEGEHLYAGHLLDVCAHLQGVNKLPCATKKHPQTPPDTTPDMTDVIGQEQARRALEVCAAGRHNILLFGPPGAGKSMLASRLPGIIPPLTESEALEVASLRSLDQRTHTIVTSVIPPFRAPHHSSSAAAVAGGGQNPKPGEVTLAHQGILFLDELPEFSRPVLEVLREPLETHCVHISRAQAQVSYPANFQLIAAMNPCPCGYFGDRRGRCHCTPAQIQRYTQKISGPLLDRIDVHLKVEALPISMLQHQRTSENSATIRQRVLAARTIQYQRQGKVNSALSGKDMDTHCSLDDQDTRFLSSAIETLGLSARAYHRVLRVARTIADLQSSPNIQKNHLAEALAYRQLDRATNL